MASDDFLRWLDDERQDHYRAAQWAGFLFTTYRDELDRTHDPQQAQAHVLHWARFIHENPLPVMDAASIPFTEQLCRRVEDYFRGCDQPTVRHDISDAPTVQQ